MLDAALAARLAQIPLGHVTREYPHKLDHVWEDDGDATTPRQQHPAFYGSFDWHSCVHGWWTLLTLRRLFPEIAEASQIAALADATFTVTKIADELAYLKRGSSAGFERPYGWAWLLQLHLEASRHGEPWARALEPLAHAFARRWRGYLAILTYPIRTGTHANTSFGVALSLPWADAFDPPLAAILRKHVIGWYVTDRDCQAWEPGGDEFLSSALTEALCMHRCLPPEAFTRWLGGFLPRIDRAEPAALFRPASVSDRSDGKIAHLDGLNLARAWCWREIAPRLPDPARRQAEKAAQVHLAAGLPHLSTDYAGEHWLASFALLALLA